MLKRLLTAINDHAEIRGLCLSKLKTLISGSGRIKAELNNNIFRKL